MIEKLYLQVSCTVGKHSKKLLFIFETSEATLNKKLLTEVLNKYIVNLHLRCMLQLHFIFQHKNPLNGSVEEKHCKKPKERLDEPFTDKAPHLYTLVVRPDNTFQISLDHKVNICR